MSAAGLAQFRRDRVQLLVFAGQGLRRAVGDGVHRLGEVADAIAVRGEAEFHLGGDLVALGDRDLAHIVAKAAEFRALPIVPGARGAHPGADAVLNFRVGPMAHDDFAGKTHARVDEARLPVAVRRLVKVHEVHVDRVPGQVAIELGMEMHERLFQRVQPAHPHFRRRKRVHPKDQAGAVGIGIRVEAKLGDLVRRRQQGLEAGPQREFRLLRERPRDLSSVRRDLLKRSRPVEMLRAANEPDFRGGEIDHGRLVSCALRIFDVQKLLHDLRQIRGSGQSPEAVVQLAVEGVKLVVDHAMRGDRLKRFRLQRRHCRFRAGEVRMRPRQHGRGDRRAESAGLARARDLHHTARDVGIDLHEQRIFLGNAAGADNLVRFARHIAGGAR